MKTTINGKEYDTDTSHKIAQYTSSNTGNPENFTETLYQMKNGELFLHYEGEQRSDFAKRAANVLKEVTEIIPLTERAAKAWLEERVDADYYYVSL